LFCLQLSSRASRKSRQPSTDEGPGDDGDVESEGRQQLSEKRQKSVSIKVTEEGESVEDEDATEAESVTDEEEEEEEPLHDGYAFKKG